MKKTIATLGVTVLALIFAFGHALGSSPAAQASDRVASTSTAQYVLRIGTVVPKSSPWGKMFETWRDAITEKSGGRLELQIYYSTTTGSDEAGIISKTKTGELQGAAVSGVGLSKVYKPISALQMLGLYSSWTQLDSARAAMNTEFVKGLSDAGYSLLGWYDIGLTRRFSKGFQVRLPTDLRGKKPYYNKSDVNEPAVNTVIGSVTGVPLYTQEVLPNLNTGAIDVVTAPALFVEQMQWAGKLTVVGDNVAGVVIGGIVMVTKAVDALPQDLKAILLDTGKTVTSGLTSRIRSDDSAAYGRLKSKMTVLTLTSDEAAQWNTTYKSARQQLSQGTYSSSLVTTLEGYAK